MIKMIKIKNYVFEKNKTILNIIKKYLYIDDFKKENPFICRLLYIILI